MQTAYPETPELADLEERSPSLGDAPAIGRWIPPVYTGEPRKVQCTPRMADVLVGLMKGWTSKQIGRHLGITEDTVKTHQKRLYGVVGAVNGTHAVALFLTGEVELCVSVPGPVRRLSRAQRMANRDSVPLPPRERFSYDAENDPL